MRFEVIIDVHAHLWGEHYEKDKRVILKSCEMFGIERIYISSLLSYYPDTDEIDFLNKLTLDFMKEQPNLVRGYVYVDPTHKNRIEVLEKGIANEMEGVKIWVAAKCDDYRVDDIAEKCIGYDVPVLVHAFHKATGQLEYESTAENVRCLALRYPELKIIMAHFGGNVYHGLRCITDLPNVYSDFSGTMIGTGDIDYAVDMIGEDRILFGTDMASGGRQCIAQIEEADLTQIQREKIFFRNALRVFGGSL
jgi:predicted TIM-barrel fold metal-dependent hydrolase